MKKVLALAAVFGFIALAGAAPGLILEGVGRYQVISPQTVSYRPSIRCEGYICPGAAYDLLVSGNYQVRERYASMGGQVEKGQVLAVLEPAAQEPVLYLQTQGRGFSQEEDLGALLESYSLSGGGAAAAEAILQTLGGVEAEGEIQVLSPVDGVVTREIPVPGSLVKAGTTVCSVENTGECYALVSVSEKDAAEITPGDEVLLTGEGVGGGTRAGVVSRIYPGTRTELSGTTAQNVVDIEVALSGGEGEIRPGFSVKAQIFTDQERQLMVLPYESVGQDEDNREYALVAAEGALEKRYITTGIELSDGVEVVEGLDGEELVAVPQEGAQEARTERYLLEKREGG